MKDTLSHHDSGVPGRGGVLSWKDKVCTCDASYIRNRWPFDGHQSMMNSLMVLLSHSDVCSFERGVESMWRANERCCWREPERRGTMGP